MTELIKQQKPETIPESGIVERRQRLIFQPDEGHESQYTANKYRVDFRRFLDYIKIHDLDVLLDLGKEAIQELVIKYTRSLRDNPEKKYSRSTVNNQIAAVLYFLENNDIELNRRKIRRYFPPDESVKDDRPYTVEEIQRITSVCDLRTKAMVLLMASSGVRIGSLSSMRIGHLIPVNYQGLELYKVRVYAGTRYEYYSLCTPECRTAIDSMLAYRERCKEVLNDKSPLFRKDFNKHDSFRMKYQVPKPLTDGAVMKAVDECLKKSGVKTSEAMRSHAWRKGFKSICEQSGMKSINVEMLLGHDIGVSGHYYRPAESDIVEDFMMHAADALTISDEHRLKKRNRELETGQAQEIDRLKIQLDEKDLKLRQTVEALEIKSKNSIDKIEKQIIKLNNMIVEVTTDRERGGMHYYRYKDLNGNDDLPRDKDKIYLPSQ